MKIQLSEYNSDWVKMYNSESVLISASFPTKDFLIEHIGSTAVPGLSAKPIIDILIGVQSLPSDIEPTANCLRTLDYAYIEKYNLLMPERRYFRKEIKGIESHHIHMVVIKSDFWERHLFFRDHLRMNAEVREQYQELKRNLAKQEWNSPNDYAEAKSSFIRSIEELRKK